ncbi:MAG: fimbrial protein FimV, partial [Pseudomonadota bacterium]|nr:fimbrial protein FimV [Pseudomonadota bacterium]
MSKQSKTIGSPVRSRAAIACAWLLAVLLAFPGLALALGLGQIVVKSKPGEPFLAEIAIVSANPAELQDLRVRLASPETFRRIGLEPPDATLAALQFAVALDDQGRPVIRVTSATPPPGPLLTFLLEVDWGEGRLVREYSALLDAPETLAAPVQSIQAPAVAPANTIPRPDAPPAEAPAPSPEPEILAEALPPAEAPAEPVPQPEVEPTAVPPAPVAESPQPETADADYRVEAGDTLSEIASGMDRRGRSLDQTMLALLRANPDAFIGGNINLVRQGAVLRMPAAEELSRYSAGEAAAIVRTQVAEWREARAARLQAAEIARAGAAGASAAAIADSGAD